MQPTPELRIRITEIVSAGLVSGVGEPKPGALCIEAAICLAIGEPHGDRPTCVADPDRDYAVRLNDCAWSSPSSRARHMLPLGLASLGTAGTDRSVWVARVSEGTIRRVLPMALRAAAWVHHNAVRRDALVAAADRCETEGTEEAAGAAARAAVYAYSAHAASAADYAASAADSAAASAASAADYAASAADYTADLVLTTAVSVALDAYAAEGRS